MAGSARGFDPGSERDSVRDFEGDSETDFVRDSEEDSARGSEKGSDAGSADGSALRPACGSSIENAAGTDSPAAPDAATAHAGISGRGSERAFETALACAAVINPPERRTPAMRGRLVRAGGRRTYSRKTAPAPSLIPGNMLL